MRRVALTVMLASAVACGSGSSGLNPAFGKTWIGTSTLNVPGLGVSSYAAHLPISVSGGRATADQLCQGTSGSITFTGSGNLASWNGSMACPPIAQPGQGCSLTFTFATGSLSLSSDLKALTAEGAGTVIGCGLNTTFTDSFQGT